jgi:Zn-finger in ubiquitin-hydrolases and other protein
LTNPVCVHTDSIRLTELPENVPGCEDCLAVGGTWVHLRMRPSGGHVGCCDDSPNRHANAHFHQTSHPIIRSAEPGEHWSWCYLDEIAFEPG